MQNPARSAGILIPFWAKYKVNPVQNQALSACKFICTFSQNTKEVVVNSTRGAKIFGFLLQNTKGILVKSASGTGILGVFRRGS